jgi:hypothetical protein
MVCALLLAVRVQGAGAVMSMTEIERVNARIVRDYTAGMTIGTIAESLNLSYGTVIARRDALGLEKRNPGRSEEEIMLIRLTHADASARTIGIPEQSRSAPVEDRMSIEMISVFEQMYSPPECRWAACWGTYDTGSVCGLGPTPEAAKADLIENYDRPAPFGSDEAEILAAIAQQYRGDHNIETLFVILTRVAFERLQLLQALKELVEASGSMAPAGGEARYETAVERAEAAISKVRI